MSLHRQCALTIFLCGVASTTSAQQPNPDGGSRWGLGIGVANAQEPYRGMDRETKALPMIRFENDYVKVGGLGLELKLPGVRLGDSSRINFGVVGRFDLAGYEADDSAFLAGMAERKGGFWAGAKTEWENELLDVNAQWLADTSGHSKGQRFSLGVEKRWRLGKQVMVVPHLTAHWLDKKYVDYYYGVRAGEAIAVRPAHAGKASTNVEAGLRTLYFIDRTHSVMLDVSVTSLAKSIKDSPLVDRSSTNRVILGYLYSF